MNHAEYVAKLAPVMRQQVNRINSHWCMLKFDASATVTGAFFGPSSDIVIGKCIGWMCSLSFRQLHGFGPGDLVTYWHRTHRHPCLSTGPGEVLLDTRPRHIATVGYQSDGTPVAWLNGVSGCIPIAQLSRVTNSNADHGSALMGGSAA